MILLTNLKKLLLFFLFLSLIPLQQQVVSADARQNLPVLQEYQYKEAKFSISFPADWKVTVQPYGSEDILFTVTAASKKPGLTAMVQVWKIKDLKGFIEQSVATAPSIDDVSFSPTQVAGLSGYFLSYRQITPASRIYVREAWLERGNQEVVRISLLIPTNVLDESTNRLFDVILSTFRPIAE